MTSKLKIKEEEMSRILFRNDFIFYFHPFKKIEKKKIKIENERERQTNITNSKERQTFKCFKRF